MCCAEKTALMHQMQREKLCARRVELNDAACDAHDSYLACNFTYLSHHKFSLSTNLISHIFQQLLSYPRLHFW